MSGQDIRVGDLVRITPKGKVHIVYHRNGGVVWIHPAHHLHPQGAVKTDNRSYHADRLHKVAAPRTLVMVELDLYLPEGHGHDFPGEVAATVLGQVGRTMQGVGLETNGPVSAYWDGGRIGTWSVRVGGQ